MVGRKKHDAAAAASAGERQSALASRLRALFETITFVDDHGRRRHYPAPYVAETISQAQHGITVHRNTIDALRNGRQTNPHHNTLWALADFFEQHRDPEVWSQPVTVAYLLGEDTGDGGEHDDEDVRRILEDHEVRSVAMRMADADPETRRTVLGILDVVQGRRRNSGGPSSSD